MIKKSELIFIALLLIPLIPMAIAKQWWLFFVFFAFYVVFGIIEFISVKKDGKTVSQKFWAYSQNHPVMAWVILLTMAVMWIALLGHLATKML